MPAAFLDLLVQSLVLAGRRSDEDRLAGRITGTLVDADSPRAAPLRLNPAEYGPPRRRYTCVMGQLGSESMERALHWWSARTRPPLQRSAASAAPERIDEAPQPECAAGSRERVVHRLERLSRAGGLPVPGAAGRPELASSVPSTRSPYTGCMQRWWTKRWTAIRARWPGHAQRPEPSPVDARFAEPLPNHHPAVMRMLILIAQVSPLDDFAWRDAQEREFRRTFTEEDAQAVLNALEAGVFTFSYAHRQDPADIAAFQQDDLAGVRLQFSAALREQAVQQPEFALDVLLDFLDRPETRLAVIDGLGAIRSAQTVPLLEALSHRTALTEEEYVAVIETLEELETVAALQLLRAWQRRPPLETVKVVNAIRQALEYLVQRLPESG